MKNLKLQGQFLIATPSIKDSLFDMSLVFLHSHSKSGSKGFIINKPLPSSKKKLLQHITNLSEIPNQQSLLIGGPLKVQQLFVLSPNNDQTPQSVNVTINQQSDDTKKANKTPPHQLITLGYCSWSTGQLMHEISNNKWLIAPFEYSIFFNTSPKDKYKQALSLLGIKPHQLSGTVGHA